MHALVCSQYSSKILDHRVVARGERFKDAKREAETVINQIYKGREALFQGSGNKVRDSPS